MRKTCLTALAFLFAALPVTGQARDPGYFEKRDEGWFFYNELEEIRIEEPKKQEEQPPPEPEKPKEEKVEKKPQGPKPLSTAWLKANIENYMMTAIDDPTPQNVAIYLYLQRVLMDKAETFAETGQWVVFSDPMLDANTARPISPSGLTAQKNVEKRARKEALKNLLGEQVGLWFFFQGGDDDLLGAEQAQALTYLMQDYGAEVMPISLTGKPLPNGFFPEFVTDQGQAADLGLIRVPALFAVHPDTQDIAMLGQSVFSAEEVGRRLILAAREHEWITEQQYLATTAGTPPAIGASVSSKYEVAADDLNNPEVLLKKLRAQVEASSKPRLMQGLGGE